MTTRSFAVRSLAILALGTGIAGGSAGTAHADGCHPAPAPPPVVVHVPVRHVSVQPAPVVRQVIIVRPAPVYRPSCH